MLTHKNVCGTKEFTLNLEKFKNAKMQSDIETGTQKCVSI